MFTLPTSPTSRVLFFWMNLYCSIRDRRSLLRVFKAFGIFSLRDCITGNRRLHRFICSAGNLEVLHGSWLQKRTRKESRVALTSCDCSVAEPRKSCELSWYWSDIEGKFLRGRIIGSLTQANVSRWQLNICPWGIPIQASLSCQWPWQSQSQRLIFRRSLCEHTHNAETGTGASPTYIQAKTSWGHKFLCLWIRFSWDDFTADLLPKRRDYFSSSC